MTTATLILTGLLVICTFFLPKRYLSLPFVIAACLIPMNQRLLLGSLDFTVLRILVFSGMLRLLARGETGNIRLNNFDILVIAWNISSTLIYTIQWASLSAFLYRCGVAYDSLGIYWIFRQVFRSFDDITDTIKLFSLCALISIPLVAQEKISQSSSIFSLFGPTGAKFHRGRFRCAGPFPHYIMLGCFWASLIPLFYSSYKARISAHTNIIGVCCALGLVYFSASSTPIMTVTASFLFWVLYKYRYQGKTFFITFCLLVIFLHIVMNAPVWHLMARANVFGGSTGWHRYFLFDQFMNHIPEWFLLGVQSTDHWRVTDITNQFVLEAIRGGALTLTIFIALLYSAVKICNESSLMLADQPEHWIAWGICISFLSHIVSFWGASYFGQILLLFYMTLAMAGFLREKNIEMTANAI
jgi:hypothetical protein